MTATEAQITEGLNILKEMADIVVETVKEAGTHGVPGGHIYAALMAVGMSLEQYERLMGLLVETKKLRKSGQLYFAV